VKSSVHSRKRLPRLIIICGLPGSGKTTLAREFEHRLGGVRLCPDDWMTALSVNVWQADVRQKIEALQWSLAQRLLETGNIVIIEWGTWSRSERNALWAGARALGAAVELHTVHAPLEVLFERIAGRAAEDPPITRDQIEQWHGQFEVPAEEELARYDKPLINNYS
jgi:predicted kinase